MPSLFDLAVERTCDKVIAEAMAPKGWLRLQITRHIRWYKQGFEPGYSLRHRAAFTKTVADRIYDRGRAGRYHFLGIPLWTYRYTPGWCAEHADLIVSEWLTSDKIKFGDPDFHWDDGHAVADEDMSNWERV